MARSTTRATALVAGTVALTLGLAACGSSDPDTAGEGTDPAAAGKVQVVASTDVWGSVAQAVGGDRVAVTSIISSPDKDPHEYESTPADAAAVEKAQLLLENGGGYDDFMSQLVESSGNRAPVVDAVTASGLQPAGEEHHAEGDGHDHGAFNEHVWYSLPAVQKVAQSVAAELGRVDPAGAAAYTANAQRFDADVTQLAARAAAVGAKHPGGTVAVTEPVPDYLLQTATLEDVTPEEFSEAVEEGHDPPAAVVAQTLALFSAQPKVGALVLNAQTQSPTTDQVRQAATQAGVPVVELSETLPAGTTDYTAWMGGQIDRLSAALDRR